MPLNKAEALKLLEEEVIKASLPLSKEATNIVFGKGNPNARVVLVGEAPGKQEDIQGLPFVGAAGKLLDQLLKLANLTLDDVYIANILKYRPPNNREPSEEEIRAHTPFLVKQLAVIKPEIIVTLGNYATKFILANEDLNKMKDVPGVFKLHGRFTTAKINDLEFKVFPTFHPAALIYNQKLRPEADEDFRKLKAELTQKSLFAF